MDKMNRRNFLAAAGAGSLGLALGESGQSQVISLLEAEERYDPWVEVRRKDMLWNVEQIRKRVGRRPIMAVIKANGYGHGVVGAGKILAEAGIRHFAVGKVAEAVQLREAGVKGMILNFGPYGKHEAVELVRHGISQSVYCERIRYLVDAARQLRQQAKVHIKVDTGLGRVGVPYYEAGEFIREVALSSDFTIEGMFTALTEDEEFDKEQLKRFAEVTEEAVRKRMSVGMRHAASSAGVLGSAVSYLDMVRPGIMLYGEYPSTKEYEARQVDLRPAMRLKARVIMVKQLRVGDSVSYHRAFTADKEMRVATIPLGYSDGYPYQVGDKGAVIIKGRKRKILTGVTANHLIVDVTEGEPVAIGDEVVLLGKAGGLSITAEDIAAWSGGSVYKVLVGMSPLLPRLYV